MALPLRYTLRSLTVRRTSSLLTALGIAMTVAVFCGVFALRSGLEQMYRPLGSEEVAVYLRPGATSEGESGLRRETAEALIKERPEIVRDGSGRPLAAAETYLAVYMDKVAGGVTNVPIRGVQPMSIELQGQALRLREGRWLRFGTDEVVVGRPLTERMKNCRIGDTLMLNVTPFKVVGVFEHGGAQGGEIWGDVERMMVALQRPFFQRVVARVAPGTDFERLATELEDDPRHPVKFESERVYLSRQTGALGGMLAFLAVFLTLIMGTAAVLGAITTMFATVSARIHEIGVLKAIGFRGASIFFSFVIESVLVGVVGGALGMVIVAFFNGMETGAVNWNTFTEVSFAFRVTPLLVVYSFALAVGLGVIGGAIPALVASLKRPVEAMRQQ